MDDKLFERLVEVLGNKAAEKLCREMGGETVYIPRFVGSNSLRLRNKDIYKKYQKLLACHSSAGALVVLAREYSKSTNTIRRIIKGF